MFLFLLFCEAIPEAGFESLSFLYHVSFDIHLLNQELASEREKTHDIEMKLKEVEAQVLEECQKIEEMTS